MTTRQNRSDIYRERIRPFLEDWEQRGQTEEWQQFRNWSVQQVLWDSGLSMDEVEEATRIDGRRDKGIDGWYLDDTTSPTRLFLIQAKDTGITREDFSKMRDGFLDVILPGRPKGANRALLEKAELFLRALPDQFELHLYLTTSVIAQPDLASNPSGEPLYQEEIALQEFNRVIPMYCYTRDIRYLVENIQAIHETPIEALFHVDKSEYFPYSVGGHTSTVTAALKAEELVALYLRHKQNLFRKNPRYYLGTSVVRNADIKMKLEDSQNEDFFIYNNGLTCVAEHIRVEPDGSDEGFVIKLDDFQIVNGCHTTATIGAVAPSTNLSRVRVLAKIIENPRTGSDESDAVSDEIATASNTQNPLKAEDWKANDRRQKAWHEEFENNMPEKWFYQIKRGTWGTQYRETSQRAPFKDNDTGKYRLLNLKDLGQECYAFLGHPAEAKDNARAIFNNSTIYDQVFDPTLTATQLLLPHVVYEAADFKTKQQPSYGLSADDPEIDEIRDRRVITEPLRYPIVTAVAQMLATLRGSKVSYLSHDQSTHLVMRKSEWVEEFVERAFNKLARALLLASISSGVGARSVVRANEWMKDSLYYASQEILNEIRVEVRAGANPGTLAHVLPFSVS